MERGEKALVPEWLKAVNGGTNGGGASTPHHSASSSQSDRTSSSYFRRSPTSNGAVMHDKDQSVFSRAYNSFGRNHRDKDWEKDLDFRVADHKDRDFTDSLTPTSRIEKDTLRRSQSTISGKRAELWPKRVANDTGNGTLVAGSVVTGIHKSTFERDFPSLGAEEKQGVPEVGRVSSPGLTSVSQSLPLGTAAVIGGEGWTSALAELPVAVGNGTALSSVQQSAHAIASTTTGLNMAETVAQTPSRVRTVPQLSIETQRLEELAIRQSRQLIPVTPSMPKASVLNSTEKPKSKTVRSNELSTVAKVGQQPLSQLVNQTVRGPSKPDVSKASQPGKLTVLKATRERNDLSPTAKDGLSPTNAGRVFSGVTSAAFTSSRSPTNANFATDRKIATSSMTQSSSVDRRSLSQAQDRIDFFNSLRKKTSANQAASVSDSSSAVSSISDKSNEQVMMITESVSEGKDNAPAPDPALDWSPRNSSDVVSNGDGCEGSETFSGDGEKDLGSDAVRYPDEEEAAFLRSMGWEENAGEDVPPLTEEEINAFYEFLKLRPSCKLSQGMEQSKMVAFESHVGSLGGASSGLSSSDSEAEM